MNNFRASLFAEFLKIKKSKVLIGTIIALSMAPIMGALFVVVLRSPELSESNSFLQAKAEMTGFSPDWPSFLNLIAQAIGIGGLIVFGFVASWVFGREYSDRTAKDLLILPVSRSMIVFSKMIAIIVWCIGLSLIIFMLGIIIGFILQLPNWSAATFFQAANTISITAILAILLCTPVAFIASVGKGYLAPLAFVILMVVFAQIIGALGFGTWFPWAIPAIYTKIIGEQSILHLGSYLTLILTSLLGFLGTIYWWNYTDQTV